MSKLDDDLISKNFENDLVATWTVPMSDKVYKIEFEHGTTTGKRILRVNGKEIIKHDWMFKLVGREMFELNGVKCSVSIDAVGIFAYEYTLQVGGKTYEKFREQQKKALQIWLVRMAEEEIRICLEKETLDVWVNGSKVETTGEFVEEGGTKTHFEIGAGASAYIISQSSGKRQIGLVHQLYVNDALIRPCEGNEDQAVITSMDNEK
uniref:Fas apoptotic inhibitory molecule 1 n=1 Tax=Meloidogyne incognita TaxID=6306 RepID=A0A914L5Q8_MELIC